MERYVCTSACSESHQFEGCSCICIMYGMVVVLTTLGFVFYELMKQTSCNCN